MRSVALFDYEFEALLDLVRRDLRRERQLASVDACFREVHLDCARMAIRILEILNPKCSVKAVDYRDRLNRHLTQSSSGELPGLKKKENV